MVAGPGFEPGPSDYEPDEVPLLHPALNNLDPTRQSKNCQKTTLNFLFKKQLDPLLQGCFMFQEAFRTVPR